VFTYDPKPQDARYGTAALPGQRFVTSWVGRRMTMGYLGNVLALCPGYCDFDVIIAHGDSLLLPLTGKPVVRVMHGSALEEARTATSLGRKVLQYGVYVQELLTAALQRGTVGVSANTRLSNRFVRTIIQNGVDLGRFASNDADRSPHPSILFVGALAGRKRGAWLVHEFVRAIQPEFPNAKLHIVATPDEPVPGVTYHTGLTRDELDALYRSAWVYASPSTYEGFGLPYVEAMASGVPVVATPNPGSCEVLDNGRYGCLMDDDRFADAVCELLRDNSRRAELAALGRERARAFDIARSAFAYEQLIARMVVQHD
jgi:glycosyltransferase involved in cell wall biosynthesis